MGYRPAVALHGPLEALTAKALRDKSADLCFDASHVIYVATANRLSSIEGSLLSRFKLFHIEDPDARAAVAIARSVAQAVLVEHGLQRRFKAIAGEVLQQLAPGQSEDPAAGAGDGYRQRDLRRAVGAAGAGLVGPTRCRRRYAGVRAAAPLSLRKLKESHSKEKSIIDRCLCLRDRLKAVLPNSPSARDAVNLVDLLMEAEDPPTNFAALRKLLGNLVWFGDGPEPSAEVWRTVAAQVGELCGFTPIGQELERGMFEHALRMDPRPEWLMFSVSQHLMLAGLPSVPLAVVLPEIDFEKARANSFDVGHAREVIRDRVRSVCMNAEHAAGSMQPFEGWSIADLENELLALRVSYVPLRQRSDGTPGTPQELLGDFHQNFV